MTLSVDPPDDAASVAGSELAECSELMLAFAERTGLSSDRTARRYLWTDAFAVCNFVALWKRTGEDRYLRVALDLVDRVHRVLGRHREDDPRRGWLSGLGDREAALHPTRGGLRIGKPLPERAPDAPFDERLEWDRDGQYFHYLTKWMHALDQTARAMRDARFNGWARELADVAHRSFCRGSGAERRLVWKMSIDLSRPLVPSMGQHDPVDGLVTCLQLGATAASLPGAPREPRLDHALADFASLTRRQPLATADPLGLGGLLMDAARVAQLEAQGGRGAGDLLEALLDAALAGLAHFARRNELGRPPSQRLAFRELGLAIGLASLGPIERALEAAGRGERDAVRERLAGLASHAKLGAEVTAFWRDPAHRRDRAWAEHRDIDEVMLATSLLPVGAVALTPV